MDNNNRRTIDGIYHSRPFTERGPTAAAQPGRSTAGNWGGPNFHIANSPDTEQSGVLREGEVVNANTEDPPHRQFVATFPSPFISAFGRPPFQIYTPQPTNEDGYIPMGRIPTWYAKKLLPAEVWEKQLEATGISGNYGGNIFLESNQSANIPEELSTALWLTNLPPDCTHQQLLGAIRGCGKIYATVINPPILPANRNTRSAPHTTSASKLVFFDRQGLDRLVAKSQAGEFSVGGYVPRVRLNRIRSAPREPGPHCRVLHIEGPSCIVNQKFLSDFFNQKFSYELEAVITLGTYPAHARESQYARQEWRFGSFRCQAESARQSIAREKNRRNMSDAEFLLWSQVMVHFGVDPCA
ncbi:hypothetical protein F4804DRAFT_343457 [Jackrogersella minutella]|nr:hypothetical protein F4804DRAFT_343457 [Jackrogersella minutella]